MLWALTLNLQIDPSDIIFFFNVHYTNGNYYTLKRGQYNVILIMGL